MENLVTNLVCIIKPLYRGSVLIINHLIIRAFISLAGVITVRDDHIIILSGFEGIIPVYRNCL